MKRKIIYILVSIFLLSPLVQAHASCDEDLLALDAKQEISKKHSCHEEKSLAKKNSTSVCDVTCALGVGIQQVSLDMFSDTTPVLLAESIFKDSLHPAFSDSLYRPPALNL